MDAHREQELDAAQAALLARLPPRFSPLQLVKIGYSLDMGGAEIEEALRVYHRKGLVEGSVREGYRKIDSVRQE